MDMDQVSRRKARMSQLARAVAPYQYPVTVPAHVLGTLLHVGASYLGALYEVRPGPGEDVELRAQLELRVRAALVIGNRRGRLALREKEKQS